MKRNLHAIALHLSALAVLVIASDAASARSKEPPVELTETGQKLEQEYTAMLDALSAEVVATLPEIDAAKQDALLTARADLATLVKPTEGSPPQQFQAYEAGKAAGEAQALASARTILSEVDSILASGERDGQLVRIAILRHATPRGLAEFAQQGDAEKALLDELFGDESLMKQMVIAGGANGGEYGEAMQVYKAILEASPRAREAGILQRVALGTALHQPWLEGKERGGVHGIVFTDHKNPDGQVERYLHYEQAFLAGELDPAFAEMTTWECRYITNDPYTNEELAWARQMLRNFRPDHITNPDTSWRYVGMVKSDFPYCSTRHDPTLGLPQQEALALGGICGRRAFFGRFITRAFGIPARRSTQTGHAAMNMWTPDGWVVRLGAWWSMNWCGPWGGLDFYLDSQAREYPENYMQVLRAQWIGDALDEEDVSLRQYGRGGGFWNGLAFHLKQLIVEDNQAAEAEAELANLSAEEARLLGESDEILGDEEVKEIEIPQEQKEIVVGNDGTITVPALACSSPQNNTDKVVFLKSWDNGMQLHYQRLGNRPEILRYSIELPSGGKYELSAKVATVSNDLSVIYRINRRTLVNGTLPYTKGMWEQTKPEVVELREGRNSIMVTLRAPNRGVSIKEFQLKPVK